MSDQHELHARAVEAFSDEYRRCFPRNGDAQDHDEAQQSAIAAVVTMVLDSQAADRQSDEAMEAVVDRLRRLVAAAPSYIGARPALHNEWVRQARELVPEVDEDVNLPEDEE